MSTPGPEPASRAPEGWIADLAVSRLTLMRDQRFRGYCILRFTAREETVLEALDAGEYAAFMADLRRAGLALRRALRPDHMNYELLGNSDPRLHWHIVPRYRDDPRWGQPIWEGWPRAEFSTNPRPLPPDEARALIAAIRAALALPD